MFRRTSKRPRTCRRFLDVETNANIYNRLEYIFKPTLSHFFDILNTSTVYAFTIEVALLYIRITDVKLSNHVAKLNWMPIKSNGITWQTSLLWNTPFWANVEIVKSSLRHLKKIAKLRKIIFVEIKFETLEVQGQHKSERQLEEAAGAVIQLTTS